MIKIRFSLKKTIYSIILFTYIFNPVIFPLNLRSLAENNTITKKNNTENGIITSEYILGSGDQLSIKFVGVDIFSGQYTIDPEGYINLPEVHRVFVEGMTLKELSVALNEKYKSFIIKPDLRITINAYRQVNVVISGEVKNPGLYSLTYAKLDTSRSTQNRDLGLIRLTETTPYISYQDTNVIAPKLFDVIRLSRGFTNYADLSNIQIIRNNSKEQGGGKIKTTIDFLSIFEKGSQENNIRMMDGDTILIPRSEKILKEQIIAINKTNITPEVFTVYVNGNVERPGKLVLDKGSSLTQAIYAAGGEKYFTGTVKHIRFNEYGKAKKNIFRFNSSAEIDSKENPRLIDGDIILVNQTAAGKMTTAIRELSSPILGAFAIYNIFD